MDWASTSSVIFRIAECGERGCVVTGVDCPGHGRSPGVRGHVGTWETVETIFDESVAFLRAEAGEEALMGLVARSMGLFLGLRYLELRPEVFSFAWLSSPLLKPSEKATGMTRSGGLFWPRSCRRGRLIQGCGRACAGWFRKTRCRNCVFSCAHLGGMGRGDVKVEAQLSIRSWGA